MANVEHSLLTGASLHEPKDIASAIAGQAYVSDGLGSGAWQLPAFTGLEVVVEKDDFPSPSAGVITLAVDTTYVISGTIDLIADTIAYSDGSIIIGFNRETSILKTNSASPLLSATGVNFQVTGIQLNNASGPLFDVDGTNTVVAALDTVILGNCTYIGTIKDCVSVAMDRVASIGIVTLTNAIRFSGTFRELFVRHCYFRLWTGICFDFATDSPVFDLVAFIGTRFFGTTSLVAVNGLTASANINDFGAFLACAFDDMTTPVTGISKADLRWVFKSCYGASNSAIIGYINMANNVTLTVPGFVDTWTKVVGTTVASASNEEFTSPNDNELQFNGIRSIQIALSVHASTLRDGPSADIHQVTVFKNSLILDANAIGTGTSAGTIQSLSVILVDTAEPGDVYSVYVQNVTDGDSLTITDLQFSIIGAGL